MKSKISTTTNLLAGRVIAVDPLGLAIRRADPELVREALRRGIREVKGILTVRELAIREYLRHPSNESAEILRML